MSKLTAEQRSARARLAAHARWSQTDRTTGTQAARSAFLRKFEEKVDPEGQLSPEERSRRAESAKKAHFTRLAMMSADARRHGDGTTK